MNKNIELSIQIPKDESIISSKNNNEDSFVPTIELKPMGNKLICVVCIMILLFIFTIFVHIIRPAATMLEIIYLARIIKGTKIQNIDYYDKGLNHFKTQLNSYFFNTTIFPCLDFDLEESTAENNPECKNNGDQVNEKINTSYYLVINEIQPNFEKYNYFLDDLINRLNKVDMPDAISKAESTKSFISVIDSAFSDLSPNNFYDNQLSVYSNLTKLYNTFKDLQDEINENSINKGLKVTGYILIFVLPVVPFILSGVPMIFYQAYKITSF